MGKEDCQGLEREVLAYNVSSRGNVNFFTFPLLFGPAISLFWDVSYDGVMSYSYDIFLSWRQQGDAMEHCSRSRQLETPQRSPAGREVLLKHVEDERNEAIKCQTCCKLPSHNDGNAHWNEQKKELHAL